MELYATDIVAHMFQRHDMPFRIGSSNRELRWQIFFADNPGMVAAGEEVWRTIPEDAFLPVDEGSGLSVAHTF